MLTNTYRMRVGQRLKLLALLTALGAVLNACESNPTEVAADPDASFSHLASARALARVREAAVRFHDVEVAIAEGYQSAEF